MTLQLKEKQYIINGLYYYVRPSQPYSAPTNDYWVQTLADDGSNLLQVANAMLNSNEGRANAALYPTLAKCWPLGIKPLPAPVPQPSPFVSVVNGVLQFNGKPWTANGPNVYQATATPSATCGQLLTDAELDTLFSSLAASGVTCIRTWFFQHLQAGFDRVLAAAKKHNLKIIATLTGQWVQCEVRPAADTQYISVKPGVGYRNRAWYIDGYKLPDPGQALSYRDYVQQIVAKHKDDDTIFCWQLVNEAEAKDSIDGPANETEAEQALRAFADDIGALIHSIDTNHLISMGTMGGSQYGDQGSDFSLLHQSPHIDLCEYHDYSGGSSIPAEMKDRAGEAKILGKPLFVGEIGLRVENFPTLKARADAFAAKRTAYKALGIQGWLPWNRIIGNSPTSGFDIGDNDPINAVFSS